MNENRYARENIYLSSVLVYDGNLKFKFYHLSLLTYHPTFVITIYEHIKIKKYFNNNY